MNELHPKNRDELLAVATSGAHACEICGQPTKMYAREEIDRESYPSWWSRMVARLLGIGRVRWTCQGCVRQMVARMAEGK